MSVLRRLAIGAAATALAAAGAAVAPVATAEGPSDRRAPAVGYLYPAGGQRGTVFQLMAGGQNLGGVTRAHVSGEGVTATVLRHVRPLNNMQQQELRRRIQDVREARRAAAAETRRGAGRNGPGAKAREKPAESKGPVKKQDPAKAKDAPTEEMKVVLPDHPLLNDLSKLSDDALEEVAARFLGTRGKQQQNNQIAETVEVEVEIAPGATPGDRELRFETPAGLTNALRFQVGAHPETLEEESAERAARATPFLTLPVLVNGQILPGDIDRFRFRARRGQRLLISTQARDLVPFLADAVPGWFQATTSVLDARGREIAWSDDAGFEPDPRLAFDVPADGDYVLEIRDALYRGREDFVYRVVVEEDPFLARTPSADEIAAAPAPRATAGYAECDDAEPNDDATRPQPVSPPCVIVGRIARPGDVDVFAFDGLAGDEVVVEVEARRLRSPLDSGVRLLDAAGGVVAWNDDFEDGEAGTITHHSDSYLRARLPADGTYRVRLDDVTGHGGPDHTYRLRVGPPRPDFELIVTPSNLSVPAGRAMPFRVHAVRRDGFAGPIDIAIAGTNAGFSLSGARIPAGRSSARLTLTAPRAANDGPVSLRIDGTARIAGTDVRRTGTPAEDRMQAFFYRHLTPTQEFVVSVTNTRRASPPVAVATALPVRVPAGGTARVEFRIPGLPGSADIRPELDEPPPGLSIAGFEIVPGGLAILLRADAAAAAPGTADNLIIDVVGNAAESARNPARRFSLGVLPALPVEVTKP